MMAILLIIISAIFGILSFRYDKTYLLIAYSISYACLVSISRIIGLAFLLVMVIISVVYYICFIRNE
jgi:UPF0716 family protein affecting phage T7 exclusion